MIYEIANFQKSSSFFLFPISILLLIVSIIEFTATKKDIQTNITDISEQEKLSKKASRTLIGEVISSLFLGGMGLSLHAILNFPVSAKPIIYLYPTEETKVKVKLEKKDNLTCTYPKYEDSWEVFAKPNGDLTDLKTGRNLYGLYWEGKNTVPPRFDEGFVVKGEDTIAFLEEKLEILGLTKREANEFIIYWLPQLEKNKYNFIRFQFIEEINENMPLEISPKPDTLIRVMMEFKPLNKPISVPEQKLHTPTRNGFVAVEWGGTKL